jgi:hypothetical protein
MMNDKGFVTSEFLIAVTIAFGMTIITFAMTFTLSTVEVVQYIVYSTSRAHAAGNFDVTAQKEEARRKYQKLIADPVFAPLFANEWFEISPAAQLEIRSGNGENFENDYGVSARKNLQGVRTTLKANLLEQHLPLVGNITPEDDGFKTRINAILLREVSFAECSSFMESRMAALKAMGNGRFSSLGNSTASLPTLWEDNGC